VNRAIIMLLVAAVFGCAAGTPDRGQETAVVLAGIPTAGEQQRIAVVFDAWLDAHLRTPDATFRLLQAGRDRVSARAPFVAVIPRSWGAPNAVANREAFVARQRQLLRAAVAGRPAQNLSTSVAASPSPRIVTLPELDSRGVRWVWRSDGAPSHVANVCDVSPSAAGIACTPQSLLHSFDRWATSALALGSTFRVWTVGTTISNAACAFGVQTPELPLAERITFLLSARNELARLFDRLPPHAGSAVAEAMTVAVTDLATRRGTKALRVLSDLRQHSGPWAFDRRVPTASAFVRWLAAERLLPDCSSIVVSICGAHFGAAPRHPPFDARHGAELRNVWTRALSEMRVASIDICSECDAEAFLNLGGGSDGLTYAKK
jgi:hypothetical protein